MWRDEDTLEKKNFRVRPKINKKYLHSRTIRCIFYRRQDDHLNGMTCIKEEFGWPRQEESINIDSMRRGRGRLKKKRQFCYS